MKIYTALHHLDLYYSLQLLFEKRLGYELYRPTGREWFTNGYWHIARPYGDDPSTIGQYLDIGSIPKDHYPPLNDLVKPEEGIYIMEDKHNNTTNKAITFDKFIRTKFDIIIASIPDH